MLCIHSRLPWVPAFPMTLGSVRTVPSAFHSPRRAYLSFLLLSFPGGSGQWRIHLQCRRPRFHLWVGKIPWRREWLPTLVFVPGELHGQRSLVGYSPWGHKESDTAEWLTHCHNTPHIFIFLHCIYIRWFPYLCVFVIDAFTFSLQHSLPWFIDVVGILK